MIGLIGYGRFGKLSVQHLAPDCDVVVHTRDTDKDADIRQAGGRLVSLAEACSQKMVLLCVPISAMQDTLDRIAPLLRPGALVVDVCSVKVLPVQWMRKQLPANIDILATHPMFGPDSATRSLAAQWSAAGCLAQKYGHENDCLSCPELTASNRCQVSVFWCQDNEPDDAQII